MLKRIIYPASKVILFIIVIFILSGCSNNLTEDQIVELKNKIPEMVFVGERIDLPSKVNGKSITISVNKPGYLDASGNVIKAETHDVSVEITVYGDKEVLFTKGTIISQKMDVLFNEAEKYIRSFVRGRTASNVKLVTTYYNYSDITIAYESNRPDIIDHDGTHFNHEYDELVAISVIVKARGKIHSFVIDVEAVGLPDTEKLKRVEEWLAEYMTEITFTDDFELPKTHPQFGGSIKWIASDPLVVFGHSRFFLPKEEKRVVLMAEISFPGSSTQKEYIYDLPASQLDDLTRAKRFIEITFEEEMDEFFVLYDGTAPYIIQNLIEGDVKNKVYGTNREELDLADLVEWFYEGYEKPNDDNILFIVVHETGIRTPGRDAKFYSEFQYNKAYVVDEPDAWTSWHYTVDDHSIYQSFQDQTECWHSGNGNIYGIGIEMCLNNDGNYNASLVNNARLIASLLIKHNLGMKSMKMHHDYSSKSCPETMIMQKRWFEFLKMISHEYVSQTLLKQFDIEYIYEDTEYISTWPIDQVIHNEGAHQAQIQNITVKIDNQEFVVQLNLRAR